METDSLWNTYTYATFAVVGLVLYFLYTYVTDNISGSFTCYIVIEIQQYWVNPTARVCTLLLSVYTGVH